MLTPQLFFFISALSCLNRSGFSHKEDKQNFVLQLLSVWLSLTLFYFYIISSFWIYKDKIPKRFKLRKK